MQRTLTSRLAAQSGLDVISFQHADCLVFERSDAVKMFLPQSKRLLGRSPKDRMVFGDLLVSFEEDLEPLRPPSKRYKFSNFVVGVPIANFPSITASSIIHDDAVDQDFFVQIRELLNALPNGKNEWVATFGREFFASPPMDRCVEAVRHLQQNR